MKTIALFFVISLISFASFASQTNPPLELYLKNQIDYPQFAKEYNEEGTVLVNFNVDDKGSVHVKESNSDNETLRKYVVRKLSELNLPFFETCEEEYNVKFVFRLI